MHRIYFFNVSAILNYSDIKEVSVQLKCNGLTNCQLRIPKYT